MAGRNRPASGDSYAFIAKRNGSLTHLLQATYLGGADLDLAYELARSSSGAVVVAGETGSPGFPGTPNGAQPVLNGFRDVFVAGLSVDLFGWTDMAANAPTVPLALAPGGSSSGLTFGCTNAGPNGATNATCSVTASSGVVSGVSCTPAVPVEVLTGGATIEGTYTYTAPGSAGGSDTAETGVTFTVATGATNDNSATNKTNPLAPVPLVDAVDDAGRFLGGAGGVPFSLGAHDQVGAGAPPGGSSFSFSGGSCVGVSVHPTTGVATFAVPSSGTCTVGYQLCFFWGLRRSHVAGDGSAGPCATYSHHRRPGSPGARDGPGGCCGAPLCGEDAERPPFDPQTRQRGGRCWPSLRAPAATPATPRTTGGARPRRGERPEPSSHEPRTPLRGLGTLLGENLVEAKRQFRRGKAFGRSIRGVPREQPAQEAMLFPSNCFEVEAQA